MFTFEHEANASEPRAAGAEVDFLVFASGFRRGQSIRFRDSGSSFVGRDSVLVNVALLPPNDVSE